MTRNIVTFDQDPIFLKFVCDSLQTQYKPEDVVTVAHIRENDDGTHTLLAVVMLDHWTKTKCELTVVANAAGWKTWEFINAVGDYVFVKNNRCRINYIIAVDNTPSIRAAEYLGCKNEGILEDWFGEGKDAYMFQMTRRFYLTSQWNKKET